MEARNAFIGKTAPPSPGELQATLGPTAALWDDFVAWMASELGVATQEWKGVLSNKYGWSLRLKVKARNIVYLSPYPGFFMVSFVLSDRAVKAATEVRFSAPVAKAIATAPRYPEGTGLRLAVKAARDLPPIRKLATIKLAN
jgi:Protein of unknown function (DUF3788)